MLFQRPVEPGLGFPCTRPPQFEPGVRLYPPKPKIGIRASEPNQIWHVDVSVFRIVSGSKVYIQAIIDNASRYVLAWQVTQDYGGANTKTLIEKAFEVANRLSANVGAPNLLADDGTENQNKDVLMVLHRLPEVAQFYLAASMQI